MNERSVPTALSPWNRTVAGNTIVDILRRAALSKGYCNAYTFLSDGESQESLVNYGELDRRARSIGALLQTLGVSHGDRVLLLYPQGIDYVAAFLGCLYAKVVAVPAYPPRRNSSLGRIQSITADSGAVVALTTTKILALVEARVKDDIWLRKLTWHSTDDLDPMSADDWQAPRVDESTLAFLQYTSGSTSTPKGVMVSHGNLLLTLQDMDMGWNHTAESLIVSWLPMFHDMGLIYGILQPLYSGVPCVFMPPAAFLQSPIRWLRAISRFRATHSGAPNFAYELCLNKISAEQRASLDLSSWHMALNAAEPVRASTLRRFSEVFAPFGFSASAFSPGYGLAECTLKATAVRSWTAPRTVRVNARALEHDRVKLAKTEEEARELVGCGGSEIGTKIVIVNPSSHTRCSKSEVGEIWLSGAVVASGYWNRPEDSADTFEAYLAETGEGPFLRTGDTGFLYAGELFITGRIKDLIIIRGVNHYPQDIELTVQQSHTALASDCGAAFSVEAEGEERLVVVQELERTARRHVDEACVIEDIRQAISEQHELQVHAVVLIKPSSLPKTSSGKIRRSACRTKFLSGELDVIAEWRAGSKETQPRPSAKVAPTLSPNATTQPNEEALQAWLAHDLSQRLNLPVADIDIQEPFARYGLDSIGAVGLSAELENWLQRRIDPTVAYDYPSIASLAKHLAGENNSQIPNQAYDHQSKAIAVIGIGCRFPRAENPEAFWSLLRNSVDAISEAPRSRWNGNGPRWGGFIDKIDEFDPQFFGISPREAEQIDPQHRLLLEVCWEAMEQTGKAPEQFIGTRSGVFVGISSNEYSRIAHESGVDPYSATGNAGSIAANRISYQFDFHGPSWAVDTACSSSLVAVHQAVQSLRRNECDLAFAGGVSLILTPNWTIAFEKAGMLSPEGRCKTFDSRADGYVRGEGCGIVMLKRLGDALRDGDAIQAVIRGSSVNQDGRSNGLTSPNGPSQQEVIRAALKDAEVGSEDISYIEAHGTGTSLGDPIELNSLKEVLTEKRSSDQTCWIGSVKTNCGHLEAAAGICGLIKVILALKHEEIPPHLHLNNLNPLISLEGTPLMIPTAPQPWRRGERRRIAGVSSFGFGGTNAHVVVEEGQASSGKVLVISTGMERPKHLFALSAKNETALQELTCRYAERLGGPLQSIPIADVCFSANTGRSHFKRRLAVIADSTSALAGQLRLLAANSQSYAIAREHPKTALLFTGQGSQYAGMGQQLYETQPKFRQILKMCDEILRPLLSLPLIPTLYSNDSASLQQFFSDGACVQAALFSLEYALYELLRSWGFTPVAVMGHSLGEYVAACAAGCFSLEDGLCLVAERGRLMQSITTGYNGAPPSEGEMIAVFTDPARLEGLVSESQGRIALAAVNGPDSAVLSGAQRDMAQVAEVCNRNGWLFERLHVNQGFHSPQIDPILDAFEEVARKVNFRPPSIPLVSNLTGAMFARGQSLDAAYWRHHARETVRFHQGIEVLLKAGVEVFLEVGPRPVLTGLGKRCDGASQATWLPSLTQGKDNWDTLLGSIQAAYQLGVDIDWKGFDNDYPRRRVSLPTYPFQRKRYWVGTSLEEKAKEIMVPSEDRRSTIQNSLSSLVADLLHIPVKDVDVRTRFLDMGADSIVFVDAVQRIQKTFGLSIPIRGFFEDLVNIELLATYIANHATPDRVSLPETAPKVSAQTALSAATQENRTSLPALANPCSAIEQIVLRQLDLMNNQLTLLRGQMDAPTENTDRAPVPATRSTPSASFAEASAPQSQIEHAGESERKTLSPEQQSYLDDFASRFTARTGRSKLAAQRSRHVFADLRSVMALRPEIKEMSYPIVAERSLGSRFWDVDGNEYIDTAMGFGVNLFGHRAPFLEQAIEEQLQRGIQVGPQSDIAAEVAELFSEITGMERVTFCNSGTEAVMAALRMVRAASGRTKIAMFSGSYHGHSDATLAVARRQDGHWHAVPMVPGVPQYVAADALVLPYGEESSLELIQDHSGELAAVLVEAVQSRSPGLQPTAFLRRLREITRSTKVALIFDEVITGFRVHPRGAQGYFEIEPDLATYGKIVGGGMPIGVVAGKAFYLDRIDGGAWNYGDDSSPEVSRTFVAGTFCKHPLAMACARATLGYLKAQGPQLQEHLNSRTARFVTAANNIFSAAGIPVTTQHFGSLFRFTLAGNTSYLYQPLEMDIFYHHLIHKGIYIWEGRTCFLSTAHSENDLEKILAALKSSIHDMQQGGFWSRSAPSSTVESHVLNVAQRSLPLTSAQRQLWALAKMDEAGSLAYTLCVALELQGPLHCATLNQAIQTVVNRHDALRIRISNDGDSQEILTNVSIDCPLTDYSSKSPQERQSVLAEWLQLQSRTPFDLSKAPLFRANLLRLDEQLHVLSVAAHHIVADGWSMSVILREVCDLYTAARSGTQKPETPQLQFGDFIHWQEQQRESTQMTAQGQYWKAKFDGLSPVLDLPTDHSRPPESTFHGHRESLRLDSDLVLTLRQHSRTHSATLFMTLLSAYALLLHRLSSQEEVVIGVPVSGRTLENCERLIGYCAHILPVRSRLVGNGTYEEYLASLKTEILVDYEHQSYPFAWLIETREAKGERSRLISALFNLDRPVMVGGMPELEVKWISQPINSTAFDLSLNATEVDGSLVLDLDGNTDLWKPSSIRRMLTQLHALLQGIGKDVRQPLREISLLSLSEQKLVISDWNQTEAEYPLNTCVHQLFEEQVERTPDAIALVSAEGQLTYRALNDSANRLAHRLRRLGADPERRVGICLDRKPQLIVGLLAILKSGAAYVPLDPSYPQERLSYIVEHAEVEILVTERSLQTGLQARSMVYLDEEDTQFIDSLKRNPESGVLAQNPAYIIYTSGSTGKPKGVILEHRSVVNFLTAMPKLTGFANRFSMLAMTSVSFDTHVLEIYLPLAFGGCIVLARAQEARDGKELGRIIRANRVSMIQATPSTYRLLVEDDPRSLREVLVISGGDALPGQLGRALMATSKGLQNFYGPTETTVYSSAHDLQGSTDSETGHDGYVPLGRPIANTRLYIFDKEAIRTLSMTPVAIGTPGELYIGGDGLARGYLKRPDLTAQRFVPDPFNPKPGSRVYSSGDLVCHRVDGVIDFLGRLDFQVKIRGHRIEIGEVEAVLATHTAVKQCVVTAQKQEAGQFRLVGYVVPVDIAPSVTELRSFLAKTLPAYMVPEAFVMLDALPMTPNRKVDRTTLPPPADSSTETEHDYVEPRTDTETAVASIYCEILRQQRVSVHDGFFDLGGQSLLAIKVRSRVVDVFGIELPARCVFDLPTVALLSEYIDQVKQHDSTGGLLPPIIPVTQSGSHPLSFAQQRLWVLEQQQESGTAFNMAGAFCLQGALNLEALRASLDEIVDRHEVLRTTYSITEEGPVQFVRPPKSLTTDLVDLSRFPIETQSSDLKRMTSEEVGRRFDLENGPLLRVTLVRCAKQALVGISQDFLPESDRGKDETEFHLLLITLHHIVFDGWSIDIFFRELSELYRAKVERDAPRLSKLPVQYKDYAYWQRRWLVRGNAVFESHLCYWQEQLKALPVLEVPTDRPRSENPSYPGAYCTFSLELVTVEQLRMLCMAEGCTLFIGFVAVFNLLLQQLSGQNEIVIGTDIANRTRTEVEGLIGFFVNQLVLRTDLSGDPSFRTLLARTREVFLAAEAHQEFPFDRLVDALHPERRSNRAPLFQIKIVFADAPPPGLKLPGLEATLIEIKAGITQLDLILFLVEAPDGLRMTFEYNTDLFDDSTIVRIRDQYIELLRRAISQPDAVMSLPATRSHMESTTPTIARRKRGSIDFERLKSMHVPSRQQNGTSGFRMSQISGESKLPAVLEPSNGHKDLSSIAAENKSFVEAKLAEYGAVLFRGFDAGSVDAFDKFTQTICSELFKENGEHPRENITGTVYRPVFFSPERKLLWHNENTFNYRWPQKIWFCCVQPAECGGETPIVDSRKVFERMDPAIRDRFMRHGIMYVRNYSDGPGLSWQKVFRTNDRKEVERYCNDNLIEFEWKDGDCLRTRSTRPAAIPHPVTGEYCWTNQAQHWHLSCLDEQTRDALLATFAEADLPRTCYYGDGSPIADEDMQSICQLYRELEVSFPWQAGDVLMVDNISTAHARNAFSGERQLLVAMGELRSYAELAH